MRMSNEGCSLGLWILFECTTRMVKLKGCWVQNSRQDLMTKPTKSKGLPRTWLHLATDQVSFLPVLFRSNGLIILVGVHCQWLMGFIIMWCFWYGFYMILCQKTVTSAKSPAHEALDSSANSNNNHGPANNSMWWWDSSTNQAANIGPVMAPSLREPHIYIIHQTYGVHYTLKSYELVTSSCPELNPWIEHWVIRIASV